MRDAIRLEGVTKTFGDTVAVRELDLAIPSGSMVGLIGPNGAGKTTTIRMIMSILFPDSGSIRVLGRASALEAKDRIGYLPEERGIYKKMKVGAFLRYIARLKGRDDAGSKANVRDWLERIELPQVESKRCEELSKGMQQKVQFVASVIHEPELVILDEPFSGLDPVNMRLLQSLIRQQHERGATVVFSTHVMVQAEQNCDHILMIDGGRKVLDDSLGSIRRRFDPRTVVVEPLEPGVDPAPLGAVPGVHDVMAAGEAFEAHLDDGVDVAGAIRALAAAIPVARVELQRPTLEDVFVQIVTESRGVSDEEARSLRTSLRDEPKAGVGA